jgi:ABC-type oligopeptide transport system ATPase subunit
MDEGYFVEDDSVKKVFANPSHPSTIKLLSYQQEGA